MYVRVRGEGDWWGMGVQEGGREGGKWDQIITYTSRMSKVLLLTYLRTFTQKFSNIDFFLKILPLKDHELVMPDM